MDHLPPAPALSRMRPVFKFKKKRPVSPLRQDRQCPLPQHLPGVDANHQQHPARNRPMGSLLQDRQCPLRQHLPSVDAGHQQSPARNRPMGPLWQDPQQATPASVNSKLSSRLAVFPRPQRIYINKFDRFNGIQGNSSSPGPQLSFVAEKTDGGRVPTGQEVIAIQRGKAPIEAAASYSDHNSTPAQLNDGIIPRGGEAVANNEGNAMSHNETNAPAESADCLLDHNSTPPAELVGEIIPTGGEEGDDVPQNGRGQILAEVEGMSEIIPRGEEGSAMTQDEEGPILAEAIGVGQAQVRRKWLTDAQRFAVYTSVHAKIKAGKLPNTATTEVAAFFQAGLRTVERIWQRAKDQLESGQQVDVSNRRTGRVGRKKLDLGLSRVATIPLNRRSTLRSLAKALNASKSTLHRRFKLGEIRRHSNALKPLLRESNKRERLQFCVSMLDQTTLSDAQPKFVEMDNIVHTDEKWFYMTKRARKYYLLPEEDNPERTVQNKNFMGKVMILVAVGRPRRDAHGNIIFSGKIGMWPFVHFVPAARKSQNRARGTIETKSIVVNREVSRQYLIEKVVPAIQAMWPQDDTGRTIFIQQDNARTHVLPNDPAFLEAVEATGMDIKLLQQPPNSPDMNVLDLGFFNSIQSLTDCRSPKTIDELIQGVEEEFEGYDVADLNRVFLSLQMCMVEVMKVGGGNGYKNPHMNKRRLEREGSLPHRLSCDKSLYENVVNYLAQS